MAEYTYEDIIMDPNDTRLEGAIGKECYFSDYPKKLLSSAIYNSPEYLDCLTDIRKEGACTFVDKNGSGWTLIIIKKEEPYEERAKKWIEKNNIKTRDYVKVTKKAESNEEGWNGIWYNEMNDCIGKALKVLAINSLRGLISLDCDDTVYDFPYFVLEKAEKPESQYVPFESKEEFVRRYTEVKEGADFDTFEDNLFQCGMWLKDKEIDSFLMVTEIWDDGVIVTDRKMKTTKVVDDEYFTINESTTWKELLRDYCFIDGSPCGKEVMDE